MWINIYQYLWCFNYVIVIYNNPLRITTSVIRIIVHMREIVPCFVSMELSCWVSKTMLHLLFFGCMSGNYESCAFIHIYPNISFTTFLYFFGVYWKESMIHAIITSPTVYFFVLYFFKWRKWMSPCHIFFYLCVLFFGLH